MDPSVFKIIEGLTPWLGGGAVTALAGLTVWLWLTYFKRNDHQWTQADQLLTDVRTERNHWREMAINRQKDINRKDELIQELRRQNHELEKKNKLLETQVEILKDERKALIDKLEKIKEK